MTTPNHSSNPLPENPQDEGNWSDCQPGEIQGLVTSLRRKKRNKQLIQTATAGTSLVVLVAVGLFSIPQPLNKGGVGDYAMTCIDVVEHAEDYVAGRLTELMNGQVESHLTHCESCQQHIATLKINFDASVVPPPVLRNETQLRNDTPTSSDSSGKINLSWSRNFQTHRDDRLVALK